MPTPDLESHDEPPNSRFAEAMAHEIGADLRQRGQNIWNVAQFYTAVVASLLTVSIAVLNGVIGSTGATARNLAALGISLVAVDLGLNAIYTFAFEGFHWARMRRVRQRVLATWRAAVTSDSVTDLAAALEPDITVLTDRGSTPREYRRLFLSEKMDEVRDNYLDGLRNEIQPDKGTRYAVRLTLESLTGIAAVVSVVSGYLLVYGSSGLAWTKAVGIAAPLVAIVGGILLLDLAFHRSGITDDDPSVLFFDLDKTLVDLDPGDTHWAEFNKRAREMLAHEGIRIEPSTTAHQCYRAALMKTGADSRLTIALDTLLDEAEVTLVRSHSIMLAGSEPETLRRLKNDGHLLGVITSNGERCLEALERYHQFPRKMFSVLVTRRSASNIKPSPEPIEEAWRRAQSKRPLLKFGWYIGDSRVDLEALRASRAQVRRQLRFALISPSAGTGTDSRAHRVTSANNVPRLIKLRHRFSTAREFSEWIQGSVDAG
jgi:phosphoglycolate phosphatase-like HAD superfamily hydrolase